jgi:predicted AlkP superfamily pyrophosphatase or phosphodiesterase
MLRFGPRGERVVTLFEAVRSLEPQARGAIVSGKDWVNSLLEDGGETVQISAAGDRGPDYIGRPLQYILGDPSSDPDRDDDPPAKIVFGQRSIGEVLGSWPHAVPSDEYIMDASLRVIAHEDPEVIYLILANMDVAQHYMGNASTLDEWNDQGTASTWDDENLVNDLATREEILDVARGADHQVGRLLDFLEARGTLDTSFVVFTADHGQRTHPRDVVQISAPLRRAGISPEELAAFSSSSLVMVYDVDEETAQGVGEVLEEWAVVFDRQEMRSGVDLATGLALALPGELFSEFWVAQDDSSEITYRWPVLFAFMRDNEQFVVERGQNFPAVGRMIGGHGGPAMQHVPLIMTGPGIPKGVVRDELVRTHQIVPTLYELLGIPVPVSVDGSPLP